MPPETLEPDSVEPRDHTEHGQRPVAIDPNYHYTVKDVACVYSISVSTVWRLVKQGKFPEPVKIGGSTRWLGRKILQLSQNGL